MAAGLGFKTFTTGEVLTAGDVNGYLMQGVLVFASAAARDAAITSPQEGQFAYLKDTNVTTYYTGSAWTNLDTTGMTNPMTTTGDTVYSSPGSTPVRLGIGSTGNVLTVAGGVPTWAAPASGGGMTLISTTSLTGSSVTISSIPGTYNNLQLVIVNYKGNADGGYVHLRINADTGTNYSSILAGLGTGDAFDGSNMQIIRQTDDTVDKSLTICEFPNYANSTTWKIMQVQSGSAYHVTSSQISSVFGNYIWNGNAAITSIVLTSVLAAFSSGTAYLYGVK